MEAYFTLIYKHLDLIFFKYYYWCTFFNYSLCGESIFK